MVAEGTGGPEGVGPNQPGADILPEARPRHSHYHSHLPANPATKKVWVSVLWFRDGANGWLIQRKIPIKFPSKWELESETGSAQTASRTTSSSKGWQ